MRSTLLTLYKYTHIADYLKVATIVEKIKKIETLSVGMKNTQI